MSIDWRDLGWKYQHGWWYSADDEYAVWAIPDGVNAGRFQVMKLNHETTTAGRAWDPVDRTTFYDSPSLAALSVRGEKA